MILKRLPELSQVGSKASRAIWNRLSHSLGLNAVENNVRG